MSTHNPYYKAVGDLKVTLQKYLSSTIPEIGTTLFEFPEGLTETEILEKYEEEFAEHSREYSGLLKTFRKDLNEYIVKWEEIPEEYRPSYNAGAFGAPTTVITVDVNGVLTILDNFPPKYNVALSNKDTLLRYLQAMENILSEEIRYLNRILEVIMDNWSDIPENSDVVPETTENQVGGTNPVEEKKIAITNTDPEKVGEQKEVVVQDRRMRKLYQRATNAIQTDSVASQAVSTDVNSATKQEILTNKANNVIRDLNAVTSKLESYLNAGALSDIPVDEESPLLRRILKKYGDLKRNPLFSSGAPSKSFEEYWREKVRAKFGGDLPFCDEVDSSGSPILVRDHTGRLRFAKAEDVIEISDGEYALKSDVDLDELRKKLRPDKYDTY